MSEPVPEGPVDAWRVFGVNRMDVSSDAVLFAPFGPIYWPDAAEGLRLWTSLKQVAGCVAEDHPAPAARCTCGIRGVVDRDVLLATAATRHVPGAENEVMAEAGVIGKVRLSGRMLPGVNIPVDDPPTTLRAEHAEILELHLGPAHAEVTPQVAARYAVPVYAHDETAWAGFVPPTVDAGRLVEPGGAEAFVAEVRRFGFGRKDLDDDPEAANDALVSVGQQVCETLKKGVPGNDVLAELFWTNAAPTYFQAQVFVEAAIENLCPQCLYTAGSDDYQDARPVTQSAAKKRARMYGHLFRLRPPLGKHLGVPRTKHPQEK